MREIKILIRATLLESTLEKMQEIAIKHFLDKRSKVIEEAVLSYEKKEINRDDINNIKKIINGIEEERMPFGAGVSGKAHRCIKTMEKEYKIRKGTAIDILISLYSKECKAINDEIKKRKNDVRLKKENFNLGSIKNQILFILFDKYPGCASSDELTEIIRRESGSPDGQPDEEIKEEIKKEIRKCKKNEYIIMVGGLCKKYAITESGMLYLVDNAALDFKAMIFRVGFLDAESLIKDAERIIREKNNSTVAKSLEFFCESMTAIIKKECLRKNFRLPDKKISIIVEKLLEYLSDKYYIPEKNEPLNNEEKDKLKKYISALEKEKNRRRLIPRDKILLSLLKDPEGMLPYKEVREKADLKTFYGKFDEILDQLTKEGKISMNNNGTGKTVKAEVRTIIGTVKEPHLTEKMFQLLKSK